MIVEGVMSGMHRSPYQGAAVEFAQHRQYVVGDDVKHLDWKVYGRSDKLYVKQYQQETNDLLTAIAGSPLMISAAWFLKISEAGLRYSLDQATRELLFQPVPAHQRPQAKAMIDVFVQRLAKGAAAILLLTVTFGVVSVPHIGWFSLVLIVVWLVLIGMISVPLTLRLLVDMTMLSTWTSPPE